ncbi:hypothetical protein BS50DRAFT_478440 [Corynespora cassiicola Philippines]|uniref:BTB/POZ domain-containing protein n=1 Tax=Corynespora cassiicola Philippines TaxID=1448308 RepID=A0A2T2P9Y9_CORCC|nr:hypothetical protein BS50DRAFT_478440 [Corynespora cassiicola Philippines]
MPDQSGHTTSRDFAFQSTDQSFAHQLGGADGATSSAYPPQASDRYDAEPTTNVPGASAASNQAHAQNPSLAAYADFGAHQTTLAQPSPAPFPGYSFSPGGPMVWDWGSSIDFPDFANHYEPQGELVQELQNQAVPANDFSIPLPVTKIDQASQAPKAPQDPQSIQLSSAASATVAAAGVQNPLSPPPKPPQRPAVQTGVKRKAESEPNSAVSQAASLSAELQPNPAKRQNKSRSSSSASATSPAVATATDARRSSMTQITAPETAPQPTSTAANNDAARRKEPSKGTGPQGRVIDVSRPRKIVESPMGSDHLPAGKVFPIQIGSELFRLSGASISSDAPSYFSHFFGEQLLNNAGRADDLRTLYIDRDPDTFRDIALHLQGYHIMPRDANHFVRLFADAQFYSLPRLTKQLFSTDIFIRIGGTPFQIPRDLFSAPGDSPNYFSLGFAQFFSTPSEVFPGLDRNALLRPPSISPPSVPNRSGEIFAELIKMLQGYTVHIKNDDHRSQLLRDARYFHLKGLEQRLIPCDISFNLKRNQSEILIRLDDIRQSGVSFTPDGPQSSSNSGKPTSPAPSLGGLQSRPGTVSYARPYTDDHAHTNTLILEVSSSESTTLYFPVDPPKSSSSSSSSSSSPPTLNLRATFHGSTLARITSLFSVVASKMGLPATQPLGLMMLQSGGGVVAQPVSPANSGVSERRVRVRISTDCYMEIDDVPVELAVDAESGRLGMRRVTGGEWLWGGARANEHEEEWVVKRAQWRLRVEPLPFDGEGGRMQVVLCGVRIQGHSVERSRNRNRGFLGS